MTKPIIIVAGALANKHRNGGEAWVRLHWALGLARMGLTVFFVEQIDPASCVDGMGQPTHFHASSNAAFFQQVTDDFGLAPTVSLVGDQTRCVGIAYGELLEIASAADLLVNISGHLHDRELLRRVRRKVYVDLDPGFTQFWHAAGNAGARVAGHDLYFTVGENIGHPQCCIPTAGVPWRPIRQPVVLDLWPTECPQAAAPTATRSFTTIAAWRGPFGPVLHDGRTFGLKVHQFRKFCELPRRSVQRFEIALAIDSADDADRRMMLAHGWTLVDPREVAATPRIYQQYVRRSLAEFSVAQGMYVDTHSGWISDRTACYLAAGKPVVVQETGASRNIPVGEGFLTFTGLEEAIWAVERVAADYQRHSLAARRIAEECFDSDKVLKRFLEEIDL